MAVLGLLLLVFALLCATAVALLLLERRKYRRLLREATTCKQKAQTFQLVAENACDGLLLQRMDSQIIWANRAYCQMLGYELDEVVGRYPLEFVLPPDLAVDPEIARNFSFANDDAAFETLVRVRNLRKSGDEFVNELNLSRVEVETETGPTQLVVMSTRDVSETVAKEDALRKAHEDMWQLAHYDGLTGLAKRPRFHDLLNDALRDAATRGGRVALCQVDLDRFKEVNDSFGHAAGDAVLRHVAEVLSLEHGDAVAPARTGGDEFCFFLVDPPDLDELADRARILQQMIARPCRWQAMHIVPSATIGVACSEPGELDAEALCKRADFALYSAKSKRKGTVGIFDSNLQEAYRRHRRIREDLAEAIDQGQLSFHFQPLLDVGRNKTTAVETLVRWTHPEFGAISPDTFLPLAREMGRMPELDFYAARAALKLLADLDAASAPCLNAGVNVSPETLLDTMFLDLVLWEADRIGVDHRRLNLEILETVFFSTHQEPDASSQAIHQLKTEGFVVVLDDFGVGHAGLSHLASLDVDGIKIDRSLVAPLPSDRHTHVIVESIVSLADKLDLRLVAEGVETYAQLECLTALGCTVIQGFGVAHPMPAKEILPWIRRHENPQALVSQLKALAG